MKAGITWTTMLSALALLAVVCIRNVRSEGRL